MNALFTTKSAKKISLIIITLILATPLVYPEVSLASSLQTDGQNNAQIFEIKVTNPNTIQNQTIIGPSLTLDQVVQSDPKYIALKAYLKSKNSPLENYTDKLLQKDNWKTVLAISFVESHMCIHNLRYNCSGIGGPGHFRKYNNFGEWVDDMSALLDSRYGGWSLDKMNGVYVQPKSANWGYGSSKILAELTKLEQNANQTQLQNSQNPIVTALATFPELTE